MSAQVFNISQPGAMGVNTQRAAQDLNPAFCLKADNFIFDSEGQLAPRPASKKLFFQPTDYTDIGYLGAYEGSTTSAGIILAGVNNKIYKTSNTNSAWTDATAGTAWTGNDWQSCTLNNKVHLFQRGQTPKVYNFATLALADCAGSPPAAHVCCTAFGRLWAGDVSATNRYTMYWSVIQDGEAWGAAGSGNIDLRTIWNRNERIVSIQPFNNFLIVFGMDSILVFSNPFTPLAVSNTGTASVSTSLALQDLIEGVGAVARDMVVNTGEDIVFLSRTGLRSLQRTIQEKSNPITTLSKNVDDELQGLGNQAYGNYLGNYEFGYKMIWLASKSWIVLTSDSAATTYVFDMKRRLDAGSVACTKWTGLYVKAMCAFERGNIENPTILAAAYTATGEGIVYLGTSGFYSGAAIETPTFEYHSTWLACDAPNVQKVPKRAILSLYGDAKSFTVDTAVDYDSTASGQGTGVTAAGFGISRVPVPLYGAGSLIQLRITGEVTIQRIGLHFQIGRSHTGV